MPSRADKSAAAAAEHFDTFPEHPLFPAEEGERTPDVSYIQITRVDLGQQVWGPVLRSDELTSTDQLFQMYGGGRYELWARRPAKNNPDHPGLVSKRKWVILAGRSKPLSPDPTAEELRRAEGIPVTSSSAAAPAPAASSSAGPMGDSGFFLALMNMQQQQSQQFMTLMMTMLTASKGDAIEAAKLQAQQQQQFMSMMMGSSQQQQQSMVAMMSAMMQSRGGGPEEMAKYVQLMKGLGLAGGSEDDEQPGGIGKMIENAADAIQGLVLLKGGQGGGGQGGTPAPASAAAPGAAPGSAASVVDEAMRLGQTPQG